MIYALFVIFVLLQIADGYATIRCLESGAGKEGNPVMAWLFDKLGVVAAFIVIKSVAIVGFTLLLKFPYIEYFLGFTIFAYVAIVWNNLLVIKNSK